MFTRGAFMILRWTLGWTLVSISLPYSGEHYVGNRYDRNMILRNLHSFLFGVFDPESISFVCSRSPYGGCSFLHLLHDVVILQVWGSYHR